MVSDDPHRFEFDLDRGIKDQSLSDWNSARCSVLTKGVAPAESGIYELPT